MIAWDRLEDGELTYAQSIGMPGRDSTNYKPCSSWSCVGHSFTIWFKEPGKLVTHSRSRARLHSCEVYRLAENDGVMLIHLRSPFTERWAQGNGQRCVGDFGEVGQLALVHRSRWRLCVRCITVKQCRKQFKICWTYHRPLLYWSNIYDLCLDAMTYESV